MRRRLRMLVSAGAALACLGAAADPATSGAVAPVATFHLPRGFYEMRPGAGSMWIARVDENSATVIFRVDPSTNEIHRVVKLPFAGGNFVLGYGSLWITDYYGNFVYRVSLSGQVRSRIRVGLSPQFLHIAFGSVWVSNHHSHSVSRINPDTNRVTATVQAGGNEFRDGPQDFADDGTRLYVGSSNLSKLQSIDPATNTTLTPPGPPSADVFCGEMEYVAGFVWSRDNCTNTLYQLTTTGQTANSFSFDPGAIGGLAVLAGNVWVGNDQVFDFDTFLGSHASLDERDPVTGSLVRSIHIGGDASGVRKGFGDLWVFNANNASVRRFSLR